MIVNGRSVNWVEPTFECPFDRNEVVQSSSENDNGGNYSISDLAELFSVSRPNVYRTLARQPNAT